MAIMIYSDTAFIFSFFIVYENLISQWRERGRGWGRGELSSFQTADLVVRLASALEMNGGSGILPYLDLAKLSYQQEGEQKGRPHLSWALARAAHRRADQSP